MGPDKKLILNKFFRKGGEYFGSQEKSRKERSKKGRKEKEKISGDVLLLQL
ncbi:MAG: hypothetical protein KJ893_04865 [Candidatus Omnitrophica bacterium]|nr:hypothetical protein [Candidatus Omnitrophota bacterium]MBU4478709.1 hypothetical protein [Candidatus Omnitrophota bacterium]